LEVFVGPRAVWKDPGHSLRASPWSVRGVPTLVALSATGQEERRVCDQLEEAASPAEVVALTASFMQRAV
jgi:hypothetical protein